MTAATRGLAGAVVKPGELRLFAQQVGAIHMVDVWDETGCWPKRVPSRSNAG